MLFQADISQRFLCTQKLKFFQLDSTTKNPIDPHCKNSLLWQRHVYRHDVVNAGGAIFTMGVYGEFVCLLSDPTEMSFLVTYKKH